MLRKSSPSTTHTGTTNAAVSAASHAIERTLSPRPRPPRAVPATSQATATSDQRRRHPTGRAQPERLDQRPGGDRQRQQLARARRPAAGDRGGERRAEHEQERRGQLLDPAPQAVPVQQRGLGREERDAAPAAATGAISGSISAYRHNATAAAQHAR